MNDKQLDALLERMKNAPLPGQEMVSDEELLQSFRRRRTHGRKSMMKRVAAVMLLASLAYCFYVSYEAIAARNAMNQWNAPEKWYFLPCFDRDVRGVEFPSEGEGHFHESLPEPVQRLLSEDTTLTDEQKAEMRWQTATFPHGDFLRIMPDWKEFGWYGCEFDMPEPLLGLDLIADLGRIDDSDETFVNGTIVGAMGKVPGGSAWQTDRIYRIPSWRLTSCRNFMAVHVWNLWGFGGIAGLPVLKAALCPQDAHWNVAAICDRDAPFAGLNSAETLDMALSLAADCDHLPWRKGAMQGQIAEWEGDSNYALFKTFFTLMDGDAPRRFAAPVVLDVGHVFDVAAFFLNGRRIGLVGRFPENGLPAFTEAAQRGRLIVPPDAWSKDGHNELAAIVYRERGRGGLAGMPGIILANPLADAENSRFDRCHELFDIYTQSMALGKAAAVLKKATPKNDGERAWLLSDMAYLSFLKWLDGGMKDCKLVDGLLSNIADIFDTLPAESPRQSAMQAFCIILRLAERDDALMAIVKRKFQHFNELCVAMQPDRLTRGDWPLAYGGDSFILAAFRGEEDFSEDKNGGQVHYNLFRSADGGAIWRWWQPTNGAFVLERNALVVPVSFSVREWNSSGWLDDCAGKNGLFTGKKMRRIAWWNDKGELHPFDDAGPDLGIQLEPAAKEQLVSLYLCDIDWRSTPHPRQQSIVVRDDDGNLLNAVWSGKTDTGVYERFLMAADVRPNIRILKHRSSCVAVAGLFRDSVPAVADGSPLAPQAIDAIVGQLPPHVADCVRIALAAESNCSVPYSKEEFGESLARLESVEEVVLLLETLSTVDGLHPLWQCMALARVKTLWRTADKATSLDTLNRLKATVRGSRLIPFPQIVDDMAKRSNGSR